MKAEIKKILLSREMNYIEKVQAIESLYIEPDTNEGIIYNAIKNKISTVALRYRMYNELNETGTLSPQYIVALVQ